MEPNQESWKPQERSMKPVSPAGYEGPPPSYSEVPPLTGKTVHLQGVNYSSRIPTAPVYSQDSPPPYSVLPTNMAYVCTPYPTVGINGVPPDDVTTREPPWTPVSPQRTNDHMKFSILSLFLCFPLGVVALIYSFKTRSAVKRGDQDAAAEASNKALILNKISRFGILVMITLVSIVIFYFVRKQL